MNQLSTLKFNDALEQVASADANTMNVSKKTIAAYLKNTFGKKVILNERENYTSTNLPLADTHYVKVNGKKVCFAYVYELGENKTFALLRTSEATAEKINAAHANYVLSTFPKTTSDPFYTLILDASYKTAEDVYDVLNAVVTSYVGETKAEEKELCKVTFHAVLKYEACGKADELYIVTNQNDWNTADAIAMTKVSENEFTATAEFEKGTELEFKVCRKNDWDNVEKGIWKEEIVNHHYVLVEKDMDVEDLIHNFRA